MALFFITQDGLEISPKSLASQNTELLAYQQCNNCNNAPGSMSAKNAPTFHKDASLKWILSPSSPALSETSTQDQHCGAMSRILPLPPDAIAQIDSSKHITSLQGVAFALLENSLDAGSSKVEITVDFSRGACAVEDDGQGIPLAEFAETGGLTKMHYTSKRKENWTCTVRRARFWRRSELSPSCPYCHDILTAQNQLLCRSIEER